MKKTATLFLVLILLLSHGVAALAETAGMSDDERIAKLRDIVQTFIDEKGYHLTYDDENHWFTGEFSLKSTLGKCDVTIFVFDDMVAVTAKPALTVSEEYKANMALFQAMVNDRLFYSHFNMDVQKGKIESFSSQVIENVFPTTTEIKTLLTEAVLILDECGDYLSRVALGADPAETYQVYRKSRLD